MLQAALKRFSKRKKDIKRWQRTKIWKVIKLTRSSKKSGLIYETIVKLLNAVQCMSLTPSPTDNQPHIHPTIFINNMRMMVYSVTILPACMLGSRLCHGIISVFILVPMPMLVKCSPLWIGNEVWFGGGRVDQTWQWCNVALFFWVDVTGDGAISTQLRNIYKGVWSIPETTEGHGGCDGTLIWCAKPTQTD